VNKLDDELLGKLQEKGITLEEMLRSLREERGWDTNWRQSGGHPNDKLEGVKRLNLSDRGR
jgi:hypothetical protein